MPTARQRIAIALLLLAACAPSNASAPDNTTEADQLPKKNEQAPAAAVFPDRITVPLSELIEELHKVAIQAAESKAVQQDYAAFVDKFALQANTELFIDYVRVKIAFEATRGGGWWDLSWAVTDREPNSDYIWDQWSKPDTSPPKDKASAIAECDELSALFAFTARKLGVQDIGLFWPRWNHTVAVWTIKKPNGKEARVVVPTSQIFLSPQASLGTTEFDPWTQKTIYEYRRKDVEENYQFTADLARRFIQKAQANARASQATLQELRNIRSALLSGASTRAEADQAVRLLRARLVANDAFGEDIAACKHWDRSSSK